MIPAVALAQFQSRRGLRILVDMQIAKKRGTANKQTAALFFVLRTGIDASAC